MGGGVEKRKAKEKSQAIDSVKEGWRVEEK